MKRKFADKANWRRVSKRKFKLTYIKNEEFNGYISAIYIEKIEEPLIKTVNGKRLCLADEGYIWMQQFPADCNYALTTMFNEKREVIQWYFDICKGNKVNRKGMPYFDDLYLDIVVLPTSEVVVVDKDELYEALQKGDITRQEYDLAWNETKNLVKQIKEKSNTLLKSSYKYLDHILKI
ncbi:DUF402 domain-containing protein [Haloimpatiens sp. FM7330]|uniref:DUF402 domain-containing protein n=1 Tax=Haloimpatiens sp. FM7330 TaxID=3298610 RepID=UPI00363542D2